MPSGAPATKRKTQTANLAKDEFLAVVSHELRAPLTQILGWLELLCSAHADQSLRAQTRNGRTELRREMTARGFSVPAIALTAYASGQDEVRARAAGYECYLFKPVGASAR